MLFLLVLQFHDPNNENGEFTQERRENVKTFLNDGKDTKLPTKIATDNQILDNTKEEHLRI